MSDRDFYPAGAYNDPSAPYNEFEYPEKEFDLEVQATIVKTIKVWTNDYQAEFDEETGRTYYDTTQTDWEKIYNGDEPTIFELLAELEKYVKKELETQNLELMRKRHLEHLLKGCEGWEEVETTFDGQ